MRGAATPLSRRAAAMSGRRTLANGKRKSVGRRSSIQALRHASGKAFAHATPPRNGRVKFRSYPNSTGLTRVRQWRRWARGHPLCRREVRHSAISRVASLHGRSRIDHAGGQACKSSAWWRRPARADSRGALEGGSAQVCSDRPEAGARELGARWRHRRRCANPARSLPPDRWSFHRLRSPQQRSVCLPRWNSRP